jgi:hypothetical protein
VVREESWSAPPGSPYMAIRENAYVISISLVHTVRTSKGKEVDRVVSNFLVSLDSNLKGDILPVVTK